MYDALRSIDKLNELDYNVLNMMIKNREREIGNAWGMLFTSGVVVAALSGLAYMSAYDVARLLEDSPIPEFDLLNFGQTPDLYDDGLAVGLSLAALAFGGAIVHGLIHGWKEDLQQNKKD